MSLATGMFAIVCNKCGKQTDFFPADADFDCIGGDPDRQMGPENIYEWNHEQTCACDNEIDINYQVSEYPEGAFNHDIVNIKGAREITRFDYDFSSPYDEVEFLD